MEGVVNLMKRTPNPSGGWDGYSIIHVAEDALEHTAKLGVTTE